MSASATPSSRRFWLCVIGLVAVAAAVGLSRLRGGSPNRPVAAYALAVDESSRLGGWFARPLTTAVSLSEGETVKIPEGARVRLLHADGRSEDVEGPRRFTPAAADSRGETIDRILAASPAEVARIEFADTKAVAGDVRLTSPVGVTRFTNPTISWRTRPGAQYDLAIIDPADPVAPARVAEKVRPPLSLEDLRSPQRPRLQRDRLYEVHVRESGSMLMYGIARLLVAHDAAEGALPDAPADLLCEAAQAMAKRPTRTGDAWLALTRLPPEWAKTEPAVRLRMRVAMELGLADEFNQARHLVETAVMR